MTLRVKLVCALMLAALLPMVVAVGAAMVRAQTRAQDLAGARLSAAARQAGILVQRYKERAASDVGQAGAELQGDAQALASLAGASRPAAAAVAGRLAERHGLDWLEILDSAGTGLSSSSPDAAIGAHSSLADLPEDDVVVRILGPGPGASEPAAPETSSPARVAFLTKRSVSASDETLVLVGGLGVERELVIGVGELLGQPAMLVDPGGHIAASYSPRGAAGSSGEVTGYVPSGGGSTTGGASLLVADVPLDPSGWKLRIFSPAGNLSEARGELLSIFAGTAPFALVTALALGLLLAAGIARPIRALARRAEEIAAERREPFTPPPAHDEVQRLTAAFDTMLASLDESARRQASAERIAAWQEVARRIAHEVKNPLSPIKLAVENLLRTRQKAPAELDRALEEESATILEEVESLRRLVDEFSQFARLPAPQPAEVDPAPIVSHALALLAPRIDALGVKTDVDDQRTGTRTIRADAEQIGRVLKNVIANALDALEPVTNRRLSIALRDREDSRGGAGLEIEVADSGVGLSPALAQRMFEPYVTTRAERGGTGLGLAIAERIVSEHGGTIRARGEPGRGATITIRLPAVGPPL